MHIIRLISLSTFAVISFLSQVQAKPLIFNFGSQHSTQDANISHAIPYSAQQTYGFDFGSGSNAFFEQHAVLANNPMYFSVLLPEGNYHLEVITGSQQQDSVTTLKVESRRVFLNQLKLAKGQNNSQRFLVNLRSPKIDELHSIDIKPREADYLNWDNKLTLEFTAHSAVQQIKISKVAAATTVFLAGDSTVTDQEQAPYASWGQMLTQYLDDSVVVANYAESGESLTSFKQSKRLAKILSQMQKGDYVFIEFSHNDEKLKGEGIGPWTSYRDLLKEFVLASRAKAGIPVLVTPTQRRFFNADGTLKPTHGDFPDAMRAVAKELKVALIDITQMSTAMYESWGDELSRKAFVQYPANTFPGQTKRLKDNTHFNTFGANEIALGVLQGIADSDLALQQAIKPGVLPYNPAMPNDFQNWTLPMSERFAEVKPDGN